MRLDIELKDISPVKKKIHVLISPEDVEREIDEAYKRLGREVSIKGFRKGKAPRYLIERLYRDRVEGEVALRLIDKSLSQALKDKGVSPLSTPEIEPHERVEAGRGFSYSATFEVAPSIDVTGYEGMELERREVRVEDEEVEKALQRLLENHAHFEDVREDRPAKDGDLVVVDFTGTVDGKALKDGRVEDYPVVIGSGSLKDPFERELIGMVKGEEREIVVEFPQDYRDRDLAGKKGVFKVTLKGIRERVLPELNDDFAKDLGFKDLEELRREVREELVEEKEEAEKERLRNEIITGLIEANPFEIPPRYLKEYEEMLFEEALRVLYRRRRPEKGVEELRRKCREKAEREIRTRIIIEAIADKEGLEVTDEEVDERIRTMAERYGQSFETMKRWYVDNGLVAGLKRRILEDKVFDLIESKASKVA